MRIKAHRRLTWQFWALSGSAGLLLLAGTFGGWYVWALQPSEPGEAAPQERIIVEAGDTATEIAQKLQRAGIIKSAFAMRIYTEVTGTRHKLQTGGYIISANESVPRIVDHLVSGRSDEYDLTILAGLTLDDLAERLERDGYKREDIKKAYAANYDHPLLASKPAGASLEGYIFPETYRVSADASLETIFERSFDELYDRLREEGLLKKFAARGLSIHEALTLGSIIQKEVSDPQEQRQVAQVFLKRLKEGQPLGSDPTFQYAARELGVEPSITLDSPYNTRVKTGLPPGPIGTMELSALKAVANPAPGDFNYFVAGDDGRTHFSHTLKEHEEKTRRYCTELCQ